jgi:hypothetical protein
MTFSRNWMPVISGMRWSVTIRWMGVAGGFRARPGRWWPCTRGGSGEKRLEGDQVLFFVIHVENVQFFGLHRGTLLPGGMAWSGPTACKISVPGIGKKAVADPAGAKEIDCVILAAALPYF